MKQDNKIITITLVLLLGMITQVALVFYDMQDTPNEVVADFAKAYFKFDKSAMSDLICEKQRVVNDVNVIDKYVYDAAREASSLGYGMFYMKNKLYNIETQTISKDHDKAKIRLNCKRKAPLRSFFTREDYVPVDEIIDLVKEGGNWKVCGSLFSLYEE